MELLEPFGASGTFIAKIMAGSLQHSAAITWFHALSG
jgi:hypothetical protein